MTNAELIQKIRAEIERQKFTIEGMFLKGDDSYYEGENDGYDRILSFLDTLESEKLMNQDLEKELARFYLKDLCRSKKDEIPEATLHHNFPIMWDDLRDIARHFAQWGAEHTPLPEDTVIYQKGVEEGKRLMMEEAVEGEVMLNPYPTICLDDCKDYDFKDGGNVRVIVLPKED